jgi:photosystem II stability/assembly factor-like uncharacterized protein
MKIYNLAFLFLLQFLFACNESSEFKASSTVPGSQLEQKRDKAGTANVVFKSTDGGQTWQDISEGLPEPVKDDNGVVRNASFADENGIYLTAGNGIYHSKSNTTVPFWTKEIFPDKYRSIAPGNSGIFAYNYWGVNLKKTNGTSVWSPIFENFHEPRIRSAFETAGGTIFIGTDRGLFKTVNSGKTWKHVHTGGLVGNLAESDGVLLATSMRRIIRSTDNGENWAVVISDSSVAFDVKPIKGGFAAITASSELGTRSLRTSYDAGKTWQPIDAGRQNKAFIDSIWRTWNDRPRVQAFMTSIIRVGENFFCTHPDGIFSSSDTGKTWKLLLPSIEDKVFNLFVSGNVIYAIPSKGGC